MQPPGTPEDAVLHLARTLVAMGVSAAASGAEAVLQVRFRFGPAGLETMTAERIGNRPAQESQHERRTRRLKLCRDAGLKLPSSAKERMPAGIGNIARTEGVSRSTFTHDVAAALQSERSARALAHRLLMA